MVRILKFLLWSFTIHHQQDLKEAVDAEVDRAETLREKIKDINTEEQELLEELSGLEQQLTTMTETDSKEYRKLESCIRRCKSNRIVLVKKRDGYERDIRKSCWTHRCERLGMDRFHRQYWWLDGWRAVGATTHSCGKLYIEGVDGQEWTCINSEDQLTLLYESLNERGVREGHLKQSLTEIREHMAACFTGPEEDGESGNMRKRGGVRTREPAFLRYKNKL
jgi:hypothetical protein